MPRRSLRAEDGPLRFLRLLFCCAVLLGAPRLARAEHGTAQALALIDVEGRYGAGLLADALWLDGPVRVGASFATGALSNGGGDQSNVFGVLAPVLWLGQPEPAGVFGALRVGGFAGGEKGGFLGGFALGTSVGYRFGLGERASLLLAAELWLFQGRDTSLLVAPAIGVAF